MENIISAVKITQYCLTGNSLFKMKVEGILGK